MAISPELLGAVEAALPVREGLSRAAVARLVDGWAPATVGCALAELMRAGRCVADGVPYERRYRRP